MTFFDHLPQWFQNAFAQYGILMLAGALVLLWIVVAVWRDARRTRQLAQAALSPGPSPTIRQAMAAMPVHPNFRVYDQPGLSTSAVSDPFLERVHTLSTALHDDHATLNAGMIDDYRRLYGQWEAVHAKREEIRAHGVELGRLYDKYRDRERQLVAMLETMHRMLDVPSTSPPTTQALNTSAPSA